MRIIRANGFLTMRGSSSETKPEAGTLVRAYDPQLNMTVSETVALGDSFLETNTSKVFILDETWREL